MKQTVELTVKLFIITAIVAALLSSVNMVTAPIIESNAEAQFKLNMNEVFETATDFSQAKADFDLSESGVSVESVYEAKKDGKICGYVASAVCSEGYGGDVAVMVGINKDLSINRVKITQSGETPGLGGKASGDDFLNQYKGQELKIEVDKNGSAADAKSKISAISGATITSKAVTKAVNASLEAAAQLKGGDK